MVAANSKVSAKKRKPTPASWKVGQSGNPTGRPKDGESWASVIKEVSNMTTDEMLSFIGKNNDLGRAIVKMPRNVQVKYLVTVRIFAALMFEPSAGLWNGMMDRAEGKVKDEVDVNLNNLTDEQRSAAVIAILDAARARKAGQTPDSNEAPVPAGPEAPVGSP